MQCTSDCVRVLGLKDVLNNLSATMMKIGIFSIEAIL